MSGLSWNVIALFVAVTVAARLFYRKRNDVSFPPGPKGVPLLGNIFDVPADCGWEKYTEWGREYKSDLVHLNVVGTHIVVVNTAKAAYELFEQRSSIYSDRPQPVMLLQLTGFDFSIALMPYGERWRAERTLFHRNFNARAATQFMPTQRVAAHTLLRNLSTTPKQFFQHLRLSTAAMILSITYGIEATSWDDPYVIKIEEMLAIAGHAGLPGAWLVDSLPFLKHVPDWAPGAGFKRRAKVWKKLVTETLDAPFQFVKKNVSDGNGSHSSIISTMLEELGGDSSSSTSKETAIKGFGANIYSAGADTAVSVLGTFFLAITLHPDVQKACQEELDRVIGHDRLPDFSDKESLPYISAVIQEILRWRPAFPMAVPHLLMSKTDDIYNGQRIPSGAMVIGNAWAMMHDESVYPDPEAFNPERFLKNGVLNPDVPQPESAWGFGRRACAGKELAMSYLFITICSVLATFNIGKAVDENGKQVTPKDEYAGGLIRHVLPFECDIKPRSHRAVDMILATKDS